MKKHFDKILVERPRRGGGVDKFMRAKEIDKDPDLAPKQQSMKKAHLNRKYLNENLAPLRRWLYSQVGRHWDKVYSELHEHVSMGNAVQAHIFQHLWGYVEKDVVMIDGVPHEKIANYKGELRPVARQYRSDDALYIHPVTKILSIAKSATKAQRKAKHEADVAANLADPEADFTHKINKNLQYQRRDTVWYRVELTHTQEKYQEPVPEWRWKYVNGVKVPPKERYVWKTRTVTTEKKTQLNKKEIKKLKLNG